MKKLFTLICAGVLMSALGAAFTACNSEPTGSGQGGDPTEVGIAPVPASEIPEDVSAFFNKYLPPISGSLSDVFFLDEQGNRNKSICLLINSAEELTAIMHLSIAPPQIDFDKYTLIMGLCEVGYPGCAASTQSLDVESGKVTLNLAVKKPESAWTVMSTLYYWGLYPKLSETVIDVNIIH